jgi:hypothetical protein
LNLDFFDLYYHRDRDSTLIILVNFLNPFILLLCLPSRDEYIRCRIYADDAPFNVNYMYVRSFFHPVVEIFFDYVYYVYYKDNAKRISMQQRYFTLTVDERDEREREREREREKK